MYRIFSAVAVVLGFSFAAPNIALAWGKKGHAVVATIADAHLSPLTKLRVGEILAADHAESMASVASWADEPIIKSLPGQPMHTVRMSMDSQPYSDALDCAMLCAIKGIRDAERTLTNQSSAMPDKVIALKYLIHLTGDLHQPLHTVMNIGGQAVILKGKPTTLHHVWDNLIIQDQGQSVRKLARNLDDDKTLQPVVAGKPEQWAVEGRDIAMNEIYAQVAPARKSAPPVTLPDNYTTEHWPTVALRLKQAGLRLAATLNMLYDSKVDSH